MIKTQKYKIKIILELNNEANKTNKIKRECQKKLKRIYMNSNSINQLVKFN